MYPLKENANRETTSYSTTYKIDAHGLHVNKLDNTSRIE